MTARLFLILALVLGPACAQAQTLAARAFTAFLETLRASRIAAE
jgi:outer membrane lipoprotein-sorting protein